MSSNNLIKTKKNIFIWYSHEHSDHLVTLIVSYNEGIVAELESIIYEYMPIENFSVDSFKKYQKLQFKKINNETTKISDLYFEKDCILSGI